MLINAQIVKVGIWGTTDFNITIKEFEYDIANKVEEP